jgi:hypothetical protein
MGLADKDVDADGVVDVDVDMYVDSADVNTKINIDESQSDANFDVGTKVGGKE